MLAHVLLCDGPASQLSATLHLQVDTLHLPLLGHGCPFLCPFFPIHRCFRAVFSTTTITAWGKLDKHKAYGNRGEQRSVLVRLSHDYNITVTW